MEVDAAGRRTTRPNDSLAILEIAGALVGIDPGDMPPLSW